MEFLVGFDVTIPDGTPESEVRERVSAAAIAAAGLARQGHLVRLWRPPVAPGDSKAVGLYRADGEAELDGLLAALPLDGWMQVTVTPLEPHPNDPASPRPSVFRLPDPRLTPVFRLEGARVLPDGTALGDIRYTLQTEGGDVLYVQPRGVRHGSAEVVARLARGEDVDPSEYTFRTSTQIETAAAELDWLNKGVFVSVGGRQPSGVLYETYLVLQ
jgi:muconolactone delta-isomerase